MRVHSRILRQDWAKLWYLLRLDDSGHVIIPLEIVQTLLSSSASNIYRWLRDGKKLGAFRRYKVRKGILEVYLGGLFKVCWHLNLRNWGTVAEVPLWEVNQLRPLATEITTQSFQQKSRYAANHKLKHKHRKHYGAIYPNELFESNRQSLHKSEVGEVPCVLHISQSRVFVSRNFVCFGASQDSISRELLIHPSTVRRHQAQLRMEKKQLCQKKGEYAQINAALKHEATEYHAIDPHGSGKNTRVGYSESGDTVHFEDGIPLGAKKQVPNAYSLTSENFSQRFFTLGKTQKTTWMAKTNIYRENRKLTTMRAARSKYRYNLARGRYNWHSDSCQKIESAVCATGF